MTGALGTYAAALIVIAASVAMGAGILVASGRREWSWSAPAIGLAAATIVGWWAVRLPGHGWTALLALIVLSALGAAAAATRLDGLGRAARAGVPVIVIVLVAVSIPFIAEGHFGVLGTGFNVDMSQHLFAASWLSDPSGPAPGLFEQGYPLGPHALAVATAEISGELTAAFSGVTIAVPVIVALTALSGLSSWSAWRATIAASLSGLAYLTATYLAQGAFKELFEIALLVGFAFWLAEFRREREGTGLLRAAPGAVLAAGTLYAYSSPGIAWIFGTLAVWTVLELLRDRGAAAERLRAVAPAVGVALALLVVIVAPEIDRISEFGGSVGTVSDSSRAERPRSGGELLAARDAADASGRRDGPEKLDFDDDLGNLFGQISPLEALGIWPSGDFRVAPGDGGVPAPVFYLGALLGALALAIGVAAGVRAGETALLAALAAALAIWIGARIGSTPYTTAKALAVLGAVVMPISLRGLLRPPDPETRPLLAGAIGTAIAAAFVLAAAASSVLALGNAPVGPRDYQPGARELTDRYEGRPTLVVIPDDQLADEHGADFYRWEFREATPPCVIGMTAVDPGLPVPPRWPRVAVVGSGAQPYSNVDLVEAASGVTIWRAMKPRPDDFVAHERACPPPAS